MNQRLGVSYGRSSNYNSFEFRKTVVVVALGIVLAACCNRTAVRPATQADPANSTNSVDPRAAQFAYPFAGTMVSPFQHFSWKPVHDATGYYLQVGTTPSSADVFAVENHITRP